LNSHYPPAIARRPITCRPDRDSGERLRVVIYAREPCHKLAHLRHDGNNLVVLKSATRTKGVIQQRLVSAGQHRLTKRGRSNCRRGFVHPADRRERYGEKRSNREVRYPGSFGSVRPRDRRPEPEEWVRCFTPDGVFQLGSQALRGHAALRAYGEVHVREIRCRHMTGNFLYKIDGNKGDRASKCLGHTGHTPRL
jgi:hypothetical protein